MTSGARSDDRAVTAALSELEQRVCDEIARREDELVELLQTLIRFDTTTHASRRRPARRGGAAGATSPSGSSAPAPTCDVWEPDVAPLAGHPMVPDGLHVRGPAAARRALRGRGGGRTLLLNGHIDVVSVEPRDRWAHDPFAAVVADGRVHGRGACDMKGGVACMVVRGRGARRARRPARGRPDREHGHGGGVDRRRRARDGARAAGRRGDRPGAGRPRRLDRLPRQPAADDHRRGPRRATPASRRATPTRAGRQRDREDGDPARGDPPAARGVGAAAAAPLPLARRDACRRSSRAASGSSATRRRAGSTATSSTCPSGPTRRGFGSRVEREFEDWIARAAAADPWLREHPPTDRVAGRRRAAGRGRRGRSDRRRWRSARPRAIGRPGELGGLDNWHDGATLIVEAGIPAICLGPGRHPPRAHVRRSRSPIDDLVACAQGARRLGDALLRRVV